MVSFGFVGIATTESIFMSLSWIWYPIHLSSTFHRFDVHVVLSDSAASLLFSLFFFFLTLKIKYFFVNVFFFYRSLLLFSVVVFVVCCHGNPADEPSWVSFVLDFMLSKGALVAVQIFLDLMSLDCSGVLSLIYLFDVFLRYCRDQNSCVFGGLPLGLLQSTRRYEMQRNGADFPFTLRLWCGRLSYSAPTFPIMKVTALYSHSTSHRPCV